MHTPVGRVFRKDCKQPKVVVIAQSWRQVKLTKAETTRFLMANSFFSPERGQRKAVALGSHISWASTAVI